MKYVCLLLLFFVTSFCSSLSFSVGLGGKGGDVVIPIPSSKAQRLYKSARNDLLQIRILLKNGRTQSSVGSGFLIGTSDVVVTNYHVVSQLVMHPDNYIGEFIDTNGKRGSVELLAVDILNDLAVVRVSRKGTGIFNVSGKLATLKQGQYLYSLGNPLDLGFTISEGAYNGVSSRGFYDRLMFTGPINSGMSGGPSVTERGQVAGVNVSKRIDGELVSFLVPAAAVQNILQRVALEKSVSKSDVVPETPFKEKVGVQLQQHQQTMVDALLKEPFSFKVQGEYRVPVRESDQMRCWGESGDRKERHFDFSNIHCSMESSVFVSRPLRLGWVAMRHQYMKATKMNALRFSYMQSASFKNEYFGSNKDKNRTTPSCKEGFVANSELPMRSVLCIKAYRDFEGLYDFSLLTGSTDQGSVSLQSRLDAVGVSYESGLRLAREFVKNIGLVKNPTPKIEKELVQ